MRGREGKGKERRIRKDKKGEENDGNKGVEERSTDGRRWYEMKCNKMK